MKQTLIQVKPVEYYKDGQKISKKEYKKILIKAGIFKPDEKRALKLITVKTAGTAGFKTGSTQIFDYFD